MRPTTERIHIVKIQFDTTKLKQQIEDNPLVAAGIGVAFLNGGARMLKAYTDLRNSKSWRKEVDRRTKKSK